MAEKWYVAKGDRGDIILSARVRLARNLAAFPFPGRLTAEGTRLVGEAVCEALRSFSQTKLHAIRMGDISSCRAVSLAEKHLISPEFTEGVPTRMLILSEDEDISIMVCEEDHLRIQAMAPGFALDEAYRAADAIERHLDSRTQLAFDERLGYLTQSPSGLGTAMRASFLLHLPALSVGWEISRLSSTLDKLGLSLCGSFGESGSAKGDLYVLSNRLTLGISEKEALDNLKAIALQLATRERTAREELMNDNAYMDKIHRAYGILNSARMISADEMMELLSLVRLGAADGSLPVCTETVNRLLTSLQPATLNADYDESMDAPTREALRAQAIRAAFARDAAGGQDKKDRQEDEQKTSAAE